MNLIEVHQNRLKRLIALPGPKNLIENEKRIIDKLLKAVRMSIILNNSLNEVGQQSRFIKLGEAEAVNINDERLDLSKVQLIHCKYHKEHVTKEPIDIKYNFFLGENVLQISSPLPVTFQEDRNIESQYILLNKWLLDMPLHKFYVGKNKVHIVTEVYIDEVTIEQILKRTQVLASKVVEVSSHVEFSNIIKKQFSKEPLE